MRGIFRAAFWLLLWMAAALPAGARAAEPPTAAQPVPVSVDELEQLVHTLQDDAARTKLVEQLRALIAVQRGTETEKPAVTALFGQLSQQIDAFSGEILAGVCCCAFAPSPRSSGSLGAPSIASSRSLLTSMASPRAIRLR